MPATVFIHPKLPTEPIRQILFPLSASRCEPRIFPRPNSVAARLGLAYEKKVLKALSTTARSMGAQVEAQPWFRFVDGHGRGQAVPDALFHFGDRTLVIEIKYTFTLDAVVKLHGLYVPVVKAAYKTRVYPLIICKNLTPGALATVSQLNAAFDLPAHIPTLQWLGHGPIAY